MSSNEVMINTRYGMVCVQISSPTGEISSRQLNRVVRKSGICKRSVRRSVEGVLLVGSLGLPGGYEGEFSICLSSGADFTLPYKITVRVHLHAQPSEVAWIGVRQSLVALLLTRIGGPMMEAVLRHSSFGKPLPSRYLPDIGVLWPFLYAHDLGCFKPSRRIYSGPFVHRVL